MNKRDELRLRSPEESSLLTPEFTASRLERELRITDKRVAQLLLILHEIDVCAAGLENFSEQQLSGIVGDAILACGFSDPADARGAIASILDVIEAPTLLNREDS